MNFNYIVTTYDKLANAAYIYLSKKGDIMGYTDSFEIKNILPFGTINLDFTADNILTGIEIFEAKALLSENILKNAINPMEEVPTNYVDTIGKNYNKERDTFFIRFEQFEINDSNIKKYKIEIDDYPDSNKIYIYFDNNGIIKGLEFINASKSVPKELFKNT